MGPISALGEIDQGRYADARDQLRIYIMLRTPEALAVLSAFARGMPKTVKSNF